jgi:hypothetical protein
MITFNVKISRNLLTPALKKIRQDLANLPAETHMEFIKQTPIDTGNARRKTRLVNQRKIVAGYSYAARLNNGWSRQAPLGMVKPVREWFKKRIKQILYKRGR